MRVSKWGDSLAVRLPKTVVDRLRLKAGDELVVIEAGDDALSLAKADRRAAALARMAARGWTPPPDYRFDRDEANAR